GARFDRLVGAAVHLGGQVHAVPVQGGGLRQVVAEADQDGLAPRRPQRRRQVRPVDAPGGSRRAGAEPVPAGRRAQVEQPPALRVLPGGGQRRDEQAVLEPDPPGGVQVGARPPPRDAPGGGGGGGGHGGESGLQEGPAL